MNLGYVPLTRLTSFFFKFIWRRKLKLSVTKTGIKVDNSVALGEIIS